MKSYYIITFDRDSNKNYKSFHNELIEHSQISNWWHYIKSAYIIATEMDVENLSDHFTATAKKNQLDSTHLVVKIDLNQHQGMLTQKAWDWIDYNNK